MWWEILPSSAAFVVCLLVPNYVAYPWHYFFQNKHVSIIFNIPFSIFSLFIFVNINFFQLYSRFWNLDEATFRLFARDKRLAGWEYLRLVYNFNYTTYVLIIGAASFHNLNYDYKCNLAGTRAGARSATEPPRPRARTPTSRSLPLGLTVTDATSTSL